MTTQGHDKPCHYCEQRCDSLAGDPGRWPVALCHADEPGIVRWHHVGCVMSRLRELDETRKQRDEAQFAELELKESLERAIDLAHEGWSYASDYFRDKWGCEERIAHEEAVLGRHKKPKVDG